MNDRKDELYERYFGKRSSSEEKSAEDEQPKRANRVGLNFSLSLMISCWSFIWAIFIIAVPQVKIKSTSVLWFIFKDATNLIVWGPVYIFLIWLSGCLILYLLRVSLGKM